MYRWLGMFRRKATPKSTDAYRTAALVVDDVFAIQVPAADQDVEAPPVMVRVDDPRLGPDDLWRPPAAVQAIRLIAVLALALMACIVIFGSRL
jgi:hypothetical protein